MSDEQTSTESSSLEKQLKDTTERLNEAKKRIEDLYSALKKFGQHHRWSCRSFKTDKCTCGFEDALKTLKSRDP